jgi:hypothetical protein
VLPQRGKKCQGKAKEQAKGRVKRVLKTPVRGLIFNYSFGAKGERSYSFGAKGESKLETVIKIKKSLNFIYPTMEH